MSRLGQEKARYSKSGAQVRLGVVVTGSFLQGARNARRAAAAGYVPMSNDTKNLRRNYTSLILAAFIRLRVLKAGVFF